LGQKFSLGQVKNTQAKGGSSPYLLQVRGKLVLGQGYQGSTIYQNIFVQGWKCCDYVV